MYLHFIVTLFWHVRRYKHQQSFFQSWTIKTLFHLNYAVHSKTCSRYCLCLGRHMCSHSLFTYPPSGWNWLAWFLFYFHPAKPSILDNTVLHREDWSEQRGQVLLRIPSVWAVSLGSFKAASCPLSATKHCKKNLQHLAGTLINFEITCVLSVLLILVQTEWSHWSCFHRKTD